MRKILRSVPTMIGIALLLFVAFVNLMDSRDAVLIPVQGADSSDWDTKSYWHYPWGKSGVHKGIDIFKPRNTPVVAAKGGLVLSSTYTGNGGNCLSILGPDLRVYYYAHLNKRLVKTFQIIRQGQLVGLVGDTGNAIDAPFHLHFSVFSLIPILKYYSGSEKMGWKKVFYLDPAKYFKPVPDNG